MKSDPSHAENFCSGRRAGRSRSHAAAHVLPLIGYSRRRAIRRRAICGATGSSSRQGALSGFVDTRVENRRARVLALREPRFARRRRLPIAGNSGQRMSGCVRRGKPPPPGAARAPAPIGRRLTPLRQAVARCRTGKRLFADQFQRRSARLQRLFEPELLQQEIGHEPPQLLIFELELVRPRGPAPG